MNADVVSTAGATLGKIGGAVKSPLKSAAAKRRWASLSPTALDSIRARMSQGRKAAWAKQRTLTATTTQ